MIPWNNPEWSQCEAQVDCKGSHIAANTGEDVRDCVCEPSRCAPNIAPCIGYIYEKNDKPRGVSTMVQPLTLTA